MNSYHSANLFLSPLSHASIKRFYLLFLYFLVSVLLNPFEYDSRTFNEKLTKLCKPDIIPDISVINPPDCIILDNWVFENFILANEPFAKALQIFETYKSVNNNFCGILVSSLGFSIKFDGRFKVTSVPFFTKTK